MPRSFAALLVVAVGVAACATVPPEVVELSYAVGKDTEELHASYTRLVRSHFDLIRQRWSDYVDTRWRPKYLKNFVETGGLVEAARAADTEEGMVTVRIWAETATAEIERYRRSLLDPVDAQERELMQTVDDAFARVLRANATVTAHVASLRKVQEVQDQLLEDLRVGNLRDQINDGLVRASGLVEKGIEFTDRGGDIVREIERTRTNVTEILEGGS
jgi:hypothetical protein